MFRLVSPFNHINPIPRYGGAESPPPPPVDFYVLSEADVRSEKVKILR